MLDLSACQTGRWTGAGHSQSSLQSNLQQLLLLCTSEATERSALVYAGRQFSSPI